MEEGASTKMPSYSYCARPGASHGYPYLVFDCQKKLHLPLITFAKDAQVRLASSSLQKYLTGILPWFTWLETDSWQVRANHQWTDPPEVVRSVIREYLVSRLQCRIKDHPLGGEFLQTTEACVNPVRILLASLKLFYRSAITCGYYQHTNPLSGTFTELAESARREMVQDTDGSLRPKMPDRSGVDMPSRAGRLTDSYFLLKDEWIPQVVTDITLPQQILNGGRALKKQGKDWGLREECLISLLFETGARVSELMALTLGDWKRRGLKDSAWTRNKGSRKRRAKFVCFSEDTVKLLKKYVNTERAAIDLRHWTLDDYLAGADRHEVELDEVPIFLSKRGTPWTVASFRTHYWKKACTASKMDVDPHQARHWYVSQALACIHAQARAGKTTVEQGVAELITYMAWRSGERVMQAYNHFYNAANHATIQQDIFQLLRASSKQKPPRTMQKPVPQETFSSMPAEKQQVMSHEEQQREKQNAVYAFLIGTGGYRDDLIELLTTE